MFFARVVASAQENGWASDAHFMVGGTLIDAWATLKSFQPKAGAKDPTDGDPGNVDVDFHGQKRSHATHQSTMENRTGLCVQAQVTTTHGVTESTAATQLLGRQIDASGQVPETPWADKGHHTAEVVGFCRAHEIKPHVATIKGRQVTRLDGRTTRSLGYPTRQRSRKRVEELFGWCKETGGLRRTRKHGTARMGLNALLILTTYNLVRMGKLLGSPPGTGKPSEPTSHPAAPGR